MIDKDRMIAVTDGVIAVAATIMVLRLDIPDVMTMSVLKSQMPTLIAYIISYAQIFLAWHEHHDALANAKIIDHRIFLINLVWLFFITVLPFATGFVGTGYNDQLSVLLYIFVLFMVDLTIKIESDYVTKLNRCEMKDIMIIRKLRKVTFASYVLAVICSFFMPMVSLAVIIISSIVCIVMMCIHDRKLQLAREAKGGY